MLLSGFKNLMLIRTDFIFYILAVVFFCGFIVALIVYMHTRQQNPNSKPTKSWTIESAKRFLESNNISVKEDVKKINENLNNASETTHINKTKTTTINKNNKAVAVKHVATKNKTNKTADAKPVSNQTKKATAAKTSNAKTPTKSNIKQKTQN